MGYISKENFEKIYIKIRQDSIENNSSVLIFVSPSADSICAAKVLLTLLKIDNIAHQIIPISGWSDLSKANQNKIESNEELRTVIMINCGGLVDLTEFLSFSEILTVYIIDSHRPYNLSNIYSTNQIVIVDDGDIEDDMADIQKAYEELEYDTDSSSSSEDDDEDEDEEEEEEEEEEIINVEDDNDNENVDTTNLRNNDNTNNRKTRKRTLDESIDEYQARRMKRLKKRQKKQQNRRIISEYYSAGTYFGMSASDMLYILATQLARTDINILWLAIVGLTDQYINGRIGHEKYLIQAQGYREDVLKFSTSVINKNENGDSENTLSLDESLNTEDIFSFNTLNSGSINGTVISAHTSSSDEILRVEDDYRLMLWRHWSLFEAMYHSSYVATKLGIWRQEGKRRLNELLLKMGFPLNQCQENYTEMDINLKKILPQKLEDMAPMFGLNEISYPSFVKQHGYKCTLSASDTVYSLNALLNRGWDFAKRIAAQEIIPTPVLPHNSSRVTERDSMNRGGLVGETFENIMDIVDPDAIYHSNTTSTTVSLNGSSTENETEEEKEEEWMEGFYMAYDALDNIDLMLYGIKSAIHLQRAIVHTGLTILEHNPSMLLKNFRFVVIGSDSVRNGLSNGTSGLGLEDNYGLFGKSVMHLEQLATFLGSAWREHGKRRSRSSKALVTAAQNDSRDTYLVVGIIPSSLGAVSHTQRNTFGLAFQNTAQRTNARVKHDSFDASVIEVKKEDLKTFIEQLQSSVLLNNDDYI
jgi:cell division control protein 45